MVIKFGILLSKRNVALLLILGAYDAPSLLQKGVSVGCYYHEIMVQSNINMLPLILR